MDTKESPVGVIASWSALCASFVLSFATWVALAEMAGFEGRLSWFMAVAVDGYIVSALVAWMAPVSEEIARFAKVNTYAGAAVGVIAQSAYHGLSADTSGGQWVPYLAAVVGALPPLAAGLSVHLRALVRRASMSGQDKRTPVRTDTTDADNGADSLPVDTIPDTSAPDTSLDADTLYVPDTWTADVPVSPAPVSVPAPRRTKVDAAWKVRARDLLADMEHATDREIAAVILEEYPGTWSTLEAGRKAVSRLR